MESENIIRNQKRNSDFLSSSSPQEILGVENILSRWEALVSKVIKLKISDSNIKALEEFFIESKNLNSKELLLFWKKKIKTHPHLSHLASLQSRKSIIQFQFEYNKETYLYESQFEKKYGFLSKNKNSTNFVIQETKGVAKYHIDALKLIQCENEKFQKLANILKKKIETNAYPNFPASLLFPLHTKNQESVIFIGRIRSQDGKIHEASFLLEGDLEMSNGDIVELRNLSRLREQKICLYLGQVVAVKGFYSYDEYSSKLFVQSIMEGIELPLEPLRNSTYTISDLQNLYHGDNIHVAVIQGKIFQWNGFIDNKMPLLNNLMNTKPHFLIILGPIYNLDTEENIDYNGIGDLQFTVFSSLRRICDFAKALEEFTKVIVVPHFSDPLQLSPSWPQPAYATQSFVKAVSIPPNLHFLTNPTCIQINEFKFFITSADPLQKMVQNGICYDEKQYSLRLCSQFLKQLTSFPGFINDQFMSSPSSNLLSFEEEKFPDIFIFTSEVVPHAFVTGENSTMFVNTGFTNNDETATERETMQNIINLYIAPPISASDCDFNTKNDLSNRLAVQMLQGKSSSSFSNREGQIKREINL